MMPTPIKLKYYETKTGKAPYTKWFKELRDPTAKAKIAVRLDRVQEGNLGDSEPVGEGVIELRIDYGPGYRIYCLPDGDELIILLCGGVKKGQQKDIETAKKYAKDYRS
jgi:putative addiction module killer protein